MNFTRRPARFWLLALFSLPLAACLDSRENLLAMEPEAFKQRFDECAKIRPSDWFSSLSLALKSCDLVNATQTERLARETQQALDLHKQKARLEQEIIRGLVATKQADATTAASALKPLDKMAFDEKLFALLRLAELKQWDELKATLSTREGDLAVLKALIDNGAGIAAHRSTPMYNPTPGDSPFSWEAKVLVRTNTLSVPALNLPGKAAVELKDLQESDLPVDTVYDVRLPAKRVSYWLETRVGWDANGKPDKKTLGGAYIDLTAMVVAPGKPVTWEFRATGGGNMEFDRSRYFDINPELLLK